MSQASLPAARRFALRVPSLETTAAWLLAIVWIFPLLYAVWAAFHPPAFMVRFDLFAPLTLENFTNAWAQAPFARYYLNTFLLVTGVVLAQFVVCTLAGFAFARFPIPGKDLLFMLVLIQLFVFPEVLIVENYRIASTLGLVDTITGIGLPYVAS
ncbi:MAG: carbohydrate ABC transporter permease, partial [Halomonas campaniensis]